LSRDFKHVAHGEMKTEIKQNCRRSAVSFQPTIDSVSSCANAKTVSGCFSVLFRGCADAWNKTKKIFVSADHRQHCQMFNCSFISDVCTSLKQKTLKQF